MLVALLLLVSTVLMILPVRVLERSPACAQKLYSDPDLYPEGKQPSA